MRMTIDASKQPVNTRRFAEDDDEAAAMSALLMLQATLKKTQPDQFARVLHREWTNRIADHVSAGNIQPVQVRGHLRVAADGRASCLGVVDEFLRQMLPVPRSIDQAKNGLSFTEADYAPGDEPEELIKRLLPRDGVTMIGGQSGAGKTFALIAMALALATGTDFLGHPVRERVGVIIAAAEGAGTIAARLEAAKRHAGITGKLPIGIIRRVPNLKDGEECQPFVDDVRMLAADMEARHGVRVGVLAIDTITSAFAIENENDNSEAAHVCKILAWMAESLGLAVVPVHHFGKSADQGLRGASAWRANVDHGLSILADRDGATGQVTARSINVMKSRIGEEGPVCGLRLVPVELGVNRYNETIVTCAVDVTDLPLPKAKEKKLPTAKTDRQFSKAFDDVMIAKGKAKRVRGDGPIVRMVPVELVRNEFMRRHVSGGASGAYDAKRKAWKRALERALDGGAYAGETDPKTGIEMIWDTMAELPFEDGLESRET